MMLSVLLRLTAYPFGIFWSWCCLYFFDWRLTPLVYFGHDVVCTSSIAGLPLWYLLVMMLSVLLAIDDLLLWYLLVMMFSVLVRLPAYPFGIFWSWCCLYFFDCRLTPLVSFGHDVVCTSSIDRLTPLVSFGHDVVCTSSIDGLPLWYLLVMMLSVLLRLTAYHFGIFWSWCCLYFFDWQLTPLVSFGHDVVCTSSINGLPFGILWSWCCLYFCDWRLTPLVSFGHDVVCTSLIDVLPLWYILVMMWSVLLRLTAYPFGISWSWCCLYFGDWQLTPLVSFGHDVVCTSSIDGLPFGIFWSWYFLYFCVIDGTDPFGYHYVVCTSSIDGLPLWYLLVMMLSVLLRLTAYPFGIVWSWCSLYFFDWWLTPLVSFGHDVVCTSSIDGLPLWYLLVMMLSVLLRLTAYPFGIFWSWCCLYFFDWWLTPLVSFGHDVVCTSWPLMAYSFGIFWSWCCLYFFDWQLTPLVSFGHDVVCTSSIDSLPLWYLLVMMLSVLLRLTSYPFGIFWSWCCLYFFDWQLTPLVSFGHDVVCTSAINDYPFGIFWSWCCLCFFDWCLTPLVSFGHDVVCTSSIDGLPLWYLLVMMLSVLLRLTAYPFGIFWSWCCLYFFDWRLTKGVSFGHDVFCTSSIDSLPLWYILVMMLSVLRLTAYSFGIFWSWCCLYFFDWLLTPLVSFGHDVVCTSSIEGLPLWYLLVMMLSVLLRLTAYPFWYLLVMILSVLLRLTAYHFGIFWSWCCLYFFDWWLTPLVSFGHDVVCTSSIDSLPLWYLLVMMLSVLRLTAYSFGIFWSWCCLYFFDWLAYPFGIFWSWCCLYFFDWRLNSLVSFGHDVVCTYSIDGLPLWYLLVMMLSILLRLTAYPFGIFWSWCCLYFCDWPLLLWYLLVMMLSVLLPLTAYSFGIFWSWCCLYFFDWRLTSLVSFGHDVFCTCSIAGLPLWYLLVMMLSVLLPLTAYSFGICWSWCCLYFFDWQLTPLVSFGHDVVCTSSIDSLPLWYLLVMMWSVLLRLTAYPFGIFWSWCCLYFCDWRLTPLVSFGHDVVCTSLIDVLPLWYILVMMWSVLLRLTAYPFGISCSWCCLYFGDWQLTPLVSFGHDVVCTSSIDGLPFGIFWSWCFLYFCDWRFTPLVSFGHDVVCTSSIDGLPLWYLLVMMLSVLLRLMAYPFGIVWSWCSLYFFDWWLTPLVSFGHDVVCTSSIDGLPLWYLLVMMLSILLRLTAYPFGIFWSWCCLYFFDWWLTPLVSFGHDVVCTSSIDGTPFVFWSWCCLYFFDWPKDYQRYLLVSVNREVQTHHGIFWSWCCLYFFDWQLTPLVSFGHDVVCSSAINDYPVSFGMMPVFSIESYPFGIFWSWCCLYFFD